MALTNTIQTNFTADGTKTVDMDAVNASGRATMHALTVIGSGAVAGTLTLYRGKKVTVSGNDTIYWDDTAAATITVSGTNLASESSSFEVAGCEHWKGVLSSLSGSSTGYWSIVYGLRP